MKGRGFLSIELTMITRIFSTLFLFATVAIAAPEYMLKSVFTSGTEGYHTYRIPAMVRANDGTLLAFCEGRKTSGADHGDIDIVLKRSSDNGATWSAIIPVQEEGNTASITFELLDDYTQGNDYDPFVYLTRSGSLADNHTLLDSNGAEIVDEAGFFKNLVFFNAKMLNNNLLYAVSDVAHVDISSF